VTPLVRPPKGDAAASGRFDTESREICIPHLNSTQLGAYSAGKTRMIVLPYAVVSVAVAVNWRAGALQQPPASPGCG